MAGDGLMTGVAVDRPTRKAGVSAGVFWLWIFTILVQFFDIYIAFDRTIYRPIVFSCYTIIAFWAAIVLHKNGRFFNIKQFLFYIAIAVIYVALPLYLWWLEYMGSYNGIGLKDVAGFILTFFPFWPLYIGLKEDIPYLHIYINLLVIWVLVVVTFKFGSLLRTGFFAQYGGRPELIQAGNVLEYLSVETYKIGQRLWSMFSWGPVIAPLLNRTGIGYYVGMVEDNQAEPVGLYITSVRLADKYNYVGSPVIIWAEMRGKSFNEVIKVNPTCMIDKIGPGTVMPKSFQVLQEEHETLTCTFDDLRAGSYRAKVGASFEFETWAYVTYYFVDLELKRSLEREGKNINRLYSIPLTTRSIYTNGPVMLGLGSLVDQPVTIDLNGNQKEPVIGFTIDNLWTEGKIPPNGVSELLLLVPDEFELSWCDRASEPKNNIVENKDGYTVYSFKRESQIDPRIGFQSVGCRFKIKDPKKLLEGSDHVQRTFVAQAKYTYNLEKTVSISVKQ